MPIGTIILEIRADLNQYYNHHDHYLTHKSRSDYFLTCKGRFYRDHYLADKVRAIIGQMGAVRIFTGQKRAGQDHYQTDKRRSGPLFWI